MGKTNQSWLDEGPWIYNGGGATLKELALAVRDSAIADTDYTSFIQCYIFRFHIRDRQTNIIRYKVGYKDCEIDLDPFSSMPETGRFVRWISGELFANDYEKAEANKIYNLLLKNAGFSKVSDINDIKYLKIILKESRRVGWLASRLRCSDGQIWSKCITNDFKPAILELLVEEHLELEEKWRSDESCRQLVESEEEYWLAERRSHDEWSRRIDGLEEDKEASD
jgi:hypothetical protein